MVLSGCLCMMVMVKWGKDTQITIELRKYVYGSYGSTSKTFSLLNTQAGHIWVLRINSFFDNNFDSFFVYWAICSVIASFHTCLKTNNQITHV